MKNCRISLRISMLRMSKFREYAANKDKTLTQLIEEYIDSLPDTKIGNSSSTIISD
ncbi:MAG: hypothetical protein ICV85_06080 [Tolypothrix sp. T3-bin4]|nr:hypothetical protein [Tolypothrix sp. Co-bin9]MBD0301748.1 hypothetical protein [Tolypothrix sp. T3-bin4]